MKDAKERKIWLNGDIVPVSEAKINVLAPTAQFGLNVFEGIPCYWNEEKQQLYAFRLVDHIKRLRRSAEMLELVCPYGDNEIADAFVKIVAENNYSEDIMARITLFADGFGSWSSSEPVGMFISPIARKFTSAEYQSDGLRCMVSSYRRISDNDLSPHIKCGANYVNSRMAQREALRNGYDTAVFMNEDGNIAEAPGSCLFIVRDGKLITPLISDGILESVTRDTVIKMAGKLGIVCLERSISRSELYICDEAFLCGSSMGLTRIVSVDGHKIKDTDIFGRLSAEYNSIVRNNTLLDDRYLHEIY